MRNRIIDLMVFLAGVCISGITIAAPATEGFVACGGNHYTRNGGIEEHTTRYNIRNPNFTAPIVITNIIMYNGNGVQVFNGIPTDTEFKQLVRPLQTSRFTSNEIGAFLANGGRPLMTFIKWRTVNATPVEEPMIGGVHRSVDSSTGFRVAEHKVGCSNVPPPAAP